MARWRTPERRDRLGDPPSEVRITVIVQPRRGRGKFRIARTRAHARRVLFLAASLAALAAIAGAFTGERSGTPSTARAARSRSAETAATAAAYRYPLGCLGVTIATGSSAHATNSLGHAGPCWRYGVYITAILRKLHGVWRLALRATSNSCPIRSLPPPVRAQVVVCTKPVTPAAHRPRSRGRQ